MEAHTPRDADPRMDPMPWTDTASRVIAASPDRVYAALVDPERF